MSKKMFAILLLCILGGNFVAYASITWIYSNVIVVSHKSSVVLTYSPSSVGPFDNMTLTATVYKNGILAGNGTTVYFEYNVTNTGVLYNDNLWFGDNQGSGDFSNTTINGVATYTINVTQLNPLYSFDDGWHFVARASP